MSLKDIETTVATDTKGFFARNKAHLIAYPVTAILGALAQHILGKLL